jgi:hypothetical protein
MRVIVGFGSFLSVHDSESSFNAQYKPPNPPPRTTTFFGEILLPVGDVSSSSSSPPEAAETTSLPLFDLVARRRGRADEKVKAVETRRRRRSREELLARASADIARVLCFVCISFRVFSVSEK